MSLETAISQFIVIILTNITGSNVRIRTGQKNEKFPLKEFFLASSVFAFSANFFFKKKYAFPNRKPCFDKLSL
jgi:hypothetical protein